MQAEFVKSVYDARDLPRDGLMEIAVAGKSNVGKSSLLNRLTGRRRLAKTSQTPGKTRCLNYFLVETGSLRPFYLVDLPGYGYAKVAKTMRRDWAALLDTYFADPRRPGGVVALFDARRDVTETDSDWLGWLVDRGQPFRVVLTKVDKLSHNERNRSLERWRRAVSGIGQEPLVFSSVTSEGKGPLWQWIDQLRRNRGKTKREK